nr:helix-turn-helix domain-containing protein [Ruminococcus bromii]
MRREKNIKLKYRFGTIWHEKGGELMSDKLKSQAQKAESKTRKKKTDEPELIDWATVKAEYVSGTMSAAKLADRYGISVSSISKKCASEHWQELRKQNQSETANKIAKKINTEKVKKTVREIDRVVAVASKLITKLNRAVNELDKGEELIKKKVTVKAEKSEDEKTATAEEEYRYDYAKRKTLVNTKRAAEISKSLLNVRDILADYTTEQDEENALGIIEIPMQEVMRPPEDDEQDGESVE